MNWKLHTRRNILSLLASISFHISRRRWRFFSSWATGPRPKGRPPWRGLAARRRTHGSSCRWPRCGCPPSVSVHIPRSHVPAARAQLLLNEAEVIDHNKILKCLCWNFEYIIELETKVAKYDAKFHNHGEGSFSVIVKPLINLRFKLYNQMCSWKNLRGD